MEMIKSLFSKFNPIELAGYACLGVFVVYFMAKTFFTKNKDSK